MKSKHIHFSFLILITFLVTSFNIKKQGPTKELMIQTLFEVNELLVNKNYEKASNYFLLPQGLSQEEINSELSKLIELKEISKDGIENLEKKGVYGKVIDIYQNKGQKEISKKQLDPENCYGILLANTWVEVMALWENESFKFFRIDNIGNPEINFGK